MAVVLSPSLSFCDLNRQQSQMFGCYPNISLQANYWTPQKPIQQHDLSFFGGDLGLEALFTTNLPTPNGQRTTLLTEPVCMSAPWKATSPPRNAHRRSHDAYQDHERFSRTSESQPASDRSSMLKQRPGSGRKPTLSDFSKPIQQFVFVPPATERFEDVLFSSLRSDLGALTQKLSNLCSLCRHPFESNDINALIRHVRSHSKELEGGFSCEQCQAKFAFKADLEWHRRCQRSDHTCHTAPSLDTAETSQNALKLIEWEQVQIKAHSREVDHAIGSRQSRSRSSSVPPVDRKLSADRFVDANRPALNDVSGPRRRPSGQTLDDAKIMKRLPNSDETRFRIRGSAATLNSLGVDNSAHVDDSHTNGSDQSSTSSLGLSTSIRDIQMRIRSLTEKIDPIDGSPADSQVLSCDSSPASSFSDSVSPAEASTPSLDIEQGALPMLTVTNSKPQECPRGSDVSAYTQTAPDDAMEGDSGPRGSGNMHVDFCSTSGPKRNNDERDDGQDGNDNTDGGFNHKRRKVGVTVPDSEKRFPCICYIGEPQRFPNDVTKHKHISNMW